VSIVPGKVSEITVLTMCVQVRRATRRRREREELV